MSIFSNEFLISKFFIIYLFFSNINCFFVIPFETIFIKDKTINNTDYFTNLTQTELVINFTIGSKKEELKLVLKMDKYGFLIYENAYDYKNSETYEIYKQDFEDHFKTNWVPGTNEYSSKDVLYLKNYSSTENNYNIVKMNKTLFLREQQKVNTSNYFNEMFYNYGIIGLKLNNNPNFNAPEFVTSLKASNDIDNKIFYLTFDNIYKNGYSTNNNKGIFYVGKDLTENTEKIKYKECSNFGGDLAWSLTFDGIYLKNNENTKIEIEKGRNRATIIGTYPYIKATDEYYDYINKIFFEDLLEKNMCQKIKFMKNDIYIEHFFYSYACNSESKYFMDKLNNNFPDLIFEHKDLNESFILTKKDLFAFNTNNDLDKNLYFLVISGEQYLDWILGIPFLKKYVLSYNYDSRTIGYYKLFGKEEKCEEESSNFFSSLAFKIIIVIVLIIIIFGLGILFNKYFNKSRKKKANELDDDFEYESHHDKDDNNIKNKKDSGSLGINE